MIGKRLLAPAAVLAILATSCGQKAGVHEAALAQVGIAPAQGGQTSDQGFPGAGPTGGNQGPTAPGSDGSIGATGGPVTTQPGDGSQGGGGGGGGGKVLPSGGDATGVTADTITIGIHAPLTGAAPLKAASFSKGKELYWQRGDNGKPVKIHGRTVRVVFQDDQYNPSYASTVCQQMAESDKAFLLVGGGGTDQIQACAKYAASKGIPYLSAGTTEVQMRSLNNYFALSMSYAQQSVLLAQYIKKTFTTDASKVAVVAMNTANFDDAVDTFKRSFPGVTIFRPEKNEQGSQRQNSLCNGPVKKFDIVFPLTSPAYYLQLAKAAKCLPQYVGVGITMGLDEVADLGCQGDQATVNARFFMPSPAFDDSDKFDPAYRKAAQAAGIDEPDDIMFLLWGLSKGLHQLLLRAGPNLTREGFIASSQNASIHTGVFPDVQYTPQNHFGAKQVHLLKNVCRSRGSAAGYYITEKAFVSSF